MNPASPPTPPGDDDRLAQAIRGLGEEVDARAAPAGVIDRLIAAMIIAFVNHIVAGLLALLEDYRAGRLPPLPVRPPCDARADTISRPPSSPRPMPARARHRDRSAVSGPPAEDAAHPDDDAVADAPVDPACAAVAARPPVADQSASPDVVADVDPLGERRVRPRMTWSRNRQRRKGEKFCVGAGWGFCTPISLRNKNVRTARWTSARNKA